MEIDPYDPYAELRARPELAIFAVLEVTLNRTMEVVLATNPQLCFALRPQGKRSIQADLLIGSIADLLEALRRYRSGTPIESSSTRDDQAE